MRGLLTRIMNALRGAMGAIGSGWGWLSDRWNTMASTSWGRATGYAWTWGVALPTQVLAGVIGARVITDRGAERIVRPIAAVGRAALTAVGGPDAVKTAALAAVSLPAAAVRGAASLPFKALRSVLEAIRPRPAVAAPAQAAAEAAGRAQAQEQKADAASDARALLNSFRKVVAARARGNAVPDEALDALPPALAAYALGLRQDECEALAVTRTAVLRILVDTGVAPDGIRSPRQVADDRDKVRRSVPDARAVRRAEVRGALRSGRRDADLEPLTA